jgi:hypothetical protein
MDVPPSEHTLSKFVEDHYKLVTSITAFTALTVFFTQIDNKELKLYRHQYLGDAQLWQCKYFSA